MFTRDQTKKFKIGNLEIGGNNHVIIQSMCDTLTKDIEKTVTEILELERYGCELIRVSVLDQEDALAIKEIKKQIHIPIVADIHFDYRLAILAIDSGADKIRINPGNIGSYENIVKVIEKAKEYNIPIRIGVNSGSMENNLKPTAENIVKSALNMIKIFEENNFYNLVISLKSSDPLLTIDSYIEFAKVSDYPLHIGLTEAGCLMEGLVKSSYSIASLLSKGIGNTIRVSLTENPIEEIKACKEILGMLDLYQMPKFTSCPTCGRTMWDLKKVAHQVKDYLNTINKNIHVAVMGCVVNGPGEAREADLGIAGSKEYALIFKHGEILRKVPIEKAFEELKKEIETY